MPGLCCFVSAKKTNVTFLCRFVIKYSLIFFQRVRTIGFRTIPRSIDYSLIPRASEMWFRLLARCQT